MWYLKLNLNANVNSTAALDWGSGGDLTVLHAKKRKPTRNPNHQNWLFLLLYCYKINEPTFYNIKRLLQYFIIANTHRMSQYYIIRITCHGPKLGRSLLKNLQNRSRRFYGCYLWCKESIVKTSCVVQQISFSLQIKII